MCATLCCAVQGNAQLLGMKGADKETNIWKIRLQLMKPVTWIPLIWGGYLAIWQHLEGVSPWTRRHGGTWRPAATAKIPLLRDILPWVMWTGLLVLYWWGGAAQTVS